jgi:hypothetical protein
MKEKMYNVYKMKFKNTHIYDVFLSEQHDLAIENDFIFIESADTMAEARKIVDELRNQKRR